MLNNLKAEMARKGIGVNDLAKLLNCSERTIKNKINEITPLTYFEAITIRNKFFKNLETEYLFAHAEK